MVLNKFFKFKKSEDIKHVTFSSLLKTLKIHFADVPTYLQLYGYIIHNI